MAKTDQSWLTFLNQFTMLVEMMGFDEAVEICQKIRKGEKIKNLEPVIRFFTKRHRSLPPAKRAAHTRKVRRYRQKVIEKMERGEL